MRSLGTCHLCLLLGESSIFPACWGCEWQQWQQHPQLWSGELSVRRWVECSCHHFCSRWCLECRVPSWRQLRTDWKDKKYLVCEFQTQTHQMFYYHQGTIRCQGCTLVLRYEYKLEATLRGSQLPLSTDGWYWEYLLKRVFVWQMLLGKTWASNVPNWK